jgi:hypothetical protein
MDDDNNMFVKTALPTAPDNGERLQLLFFQKAEDTSAERKKGYNWGWLCRVNHPSIDAIRTAMLAR